MSSTISSIVPSTSTLSRPTNRPARFQVDLIDSISPAILDRRQGPNIAPSNLGYPDCSFVGNGILTCYPTQNSTLVQHEFSKFVWNSRFPVFIGSRNVDIYLWSAGPEVLQVSWKGIENARGSIGLYPNDTYFPVQTSFAGQNITRQYFFVIVQANAILNGGESHQATFSIVQTAAPETLIASQSSASVASASSLSVQSSLSSLSVASVASVLSLQSRSSNSQNTITPSPTSTASISNSSSSSANSSSLRPDTVGSTNLPRYAIILVVVLTILGGIALLLLLYFCIRKARRQKTNPRSLNSETIPIMVAGGKSRDSSVEGSTTTEKPIPMEGAVSGTEGLSSMDATQMAEAFRQALRQPDYSNEPDSNPSDELNPIDDDVEGDERGRALLDKELASEGLKSVGSNQGKKWGNPI